MRPPRVETDAIARARAGIKTSLVLALIPFAGMLMLALVSPI
jgi:hypothetical protein